MDKSLETLTRTARELAANYSELQRLRRLVEELEKYSGSSRDRKRFEKTRQRRVVYLNEKAAEKLPHRAPLPRAFERTLSMNIINSQGIHVAQVKGTAIFDLGGQKLYHLKGVNIYRPSGELVGHLPHTEKYDNERRLARSGDKLFPVVSRSSQTTRRA
jgi:hypothetical protein